MYHRDQLLPFQLFSKCTNKHSFILSDFNAKYISWNCKQSNTSGVHILNKLEGAGNDMIILKTPTSRRSCSIIDFGITQDSSGWNRELLQKGTSNDWPVFFNHLYLLKTQCYSDKQTGHYLLSFYQLLLNIGIPSSTTLI
jgi:hypothetical protein